MTYWYTYRVQKSLWFWYFSSLSIHKCMYDLFWRLSSRRNNVVHFSRFQFRIEETKLAAPCRCSGAARGQRLIFWCARWKGETDMCTVTRMCGRTVALAERWPCLIAVRSRTSALTLIAECHTLCELHERNDCPPHLISVINFTFVRSPFQCNLVLCVATYIHYSLSPGNLLHLFDLRCWQDDDSAVSDEMERDYASYKSSFALIVY